MGIQGEKENSALLTDNIFGASNWGRQSKLPPSIPPLAAPLSLIKGKYICLRCEKRSSALYRKANWDNYFCGRCFKEIQEKGGEK